MSYDFNSFFSNSTVKSLSFASLQFHTFIRNCLGLTGNDKYIVLEPLIVTCLFAYSELGFPLSSAMTPNVFSPLHYIVMLRLNFLLLESYILANITLFC